MGNGGGGARVIAIALLLLATLYGCAATRPVSKAEEPPGLSVRLPPAALTTLDIQPQRIGYPELPLSVADESRGRWLTLFEFNYTPVQQPPPITEEEP